MKSMRGDAIAVLLLAAVLQGASGQGQVPRGSYTKEMFTSSLVDEAPDDCDEMMGCAGVTYRFEDSLEAKRQKLNKTDDGEEHLDEFPFDVGNPDGEDEKENSVYFHSFLPPLRSQGAQGAQGAQRDTNSNSDETRWVTYRSKKPFVFHPGKIVPGSAPSSAPSASTSYTLHDLSIQQAKQECQNNPQCIGFSFPVQSSNLLHPENITFATSVWSIHDDGSEQWRTYLSNDEQRAASVNQFNLKIAEQDLMEPYQSCCQKANENGRTVPSIQEVQAMDGLERIPCNISREEFFEHYELERRPVILVGCDTHWKARQRWTHEALIPRFDNSSIWRAAVNDQHEKNDTTWKQVVDAMTNDRHFYIFDQLEHPHQQTLDEDYEFPLPFRDIDLYRNIQFPPDYGPMKWFCLGSQYSGTFPHSDPYSTDAWNTVIYGHKWWILYPEGVEEEEVECNDDCSIEDPFELDWYTSVGVNAARSEYGSEGRRPIHILQKPGETIYVPFGIVHSVLNMDDTAAVTSNYGAPGNVETVWNNVVEEGDYKHWMKLYYGGNLDSEQRSIVRESASWPPWERDDDDDEDDDEEGDYGEEEFDEEEAEYEELNNDFFGFKE